MTGCPFASRRGFLGAAGGLLAGISTGGASAPPAGSDAGKIARGITPGSEVPNRSVVEPFAGPHQAGILTPLQNQLFFAAFDVDSKKRDDLIGVLRAWTKAAARLAVGDPAAPIGDDPNKPTADSGDTLGLGPARLTMTFGLGPDLFDDRFGLAAKRPEALATLPRFNGDQLEPNRTGGDLCIQACADDPQVAFHAIRSLARQAGYTVRLRWTQTGFSAGAAAEDTPRNLMGFKDGTQNPIAARPLVQTDGIVQPQPLDPETIIWAGAEAPAWMRGGTYLVVRRIRIALEHWDNTDLGFQEETIGRHKTSGAPLGRKSEFDALDLDATDADGNLVIPGNAHVRLAAAETNGGAQILRRSFSYNDGTNVVAERWPPWRQGLEYDAGLVFVCFQRDPRQGFIRIYENMAKLDAMNQYVTHTGGGLFACPRGVQGESFIGEELFS